MPPSPQSVPSRPLPQALESLAEGECLRFGVEELSLPRYLAFNPAIGATIVIERTETGVKLAIEPPAWEPTLAACEGDSYPITRGS